MSAAKMVADSTQGDLDEPKKKRKRKRENFRKKSKKLKKRDSKKRKSIKKEDEDSDLDLEKELQPIGDYIKERYEMNEQLFHCLRGPTLQRYVPDVLKELPLEVLKKRCLEHLEIMSKKRIRRILAGDDPGTISSSGTEEESSSEEMEHEEAPQEIDDDQSSDIDDNKEYGGEKGSDTDDERESDVEDYKGSEDDDDEKESDIEKKSGGLWSDMDEEVNEELEEGETISDEDEDYIRDKSNNEGEVSAETEGEISSDETDEDQEDIHKKDEDQEDIDEKEEDQEDIHQKEEDWETIHKTEKDHGDIAKKEDVQDQDNKDADKMDNRGSKIQDQIKLEEDCRVRMESKIDSDENSHNEVDSDEKMVQNDVYRNKNEITEHGNEDWNSLNRDKSQELMQKNNDVNKSYEKTTMKEREITDENLLKTFSTSQPSTSLGENEKGEKKDFELPEKDGSITIDAEKSINIGDSRDGKESAEQKCDISEEKDNSVEQYDSEDALSLEDVDSSVLDKTSQKQEDRVQIDMAESSGETNNMEQDKSDLITNNEQEKESKQGTCNAQNDQSEEMQDVGSINARQSESNSETNPAKSDTRKVEFSGTREINQTRSFVLSKALEGRDSQVRTVSILPKTGPSKTLSAVSSTQSVKPPLKSVMDRLGSQKTVAYVTSTTSKIFTKDPSAKSFSKLTSASSLSKQPSKLYSQTSSALSSRTVSKEPSLKETSPKTSNLPMSQIVSEPSSSKGTLKSSEIEASSKSEETLAPVLTKNQMELLELEMRARAIKAMLAAHEKKEKELEKESKL